MNYETLDRKQCFINGNNNITNSNISNVRTFDSGCCSLEKASNNRPSEERNSEFDNSDENIVRKNLYLLHLKTIKLMKN